MGGHPSLPDPLVVKGGSVILDIGRLDTDEIIHEWTVFPGIKVFVVLVEKIDLKGKICDGFRPTRKFVGDLADEASSAKFIAGAFLASVEAGSFFWVPPAAICSVIIVRYGWDRYCEGQYPPVE